MPFGCNCSALLPIRTCGPYANHGDTTRALELLSQCVSGQVANGTNPVTSPAAALAEAFPDGFDVNCTPDVLFISRPDGAQYMSQDQGVSWLNVGGSAGAASSVQANTILNNSAVTLNLGNVVVWDFAADSAVDVSTDETTDTIAGVWQETTLAGNSGTLTNRGISSVLVDGPVSRGDVLVLSSTVAGRATRLVPGLGAFQIIGTALESLASAGSVLAFVDIKAVSNPDIHVHVHHASNTSIGAGATVELPWDTEDRDTYGMHDTVTNNTDLIPPVDGLYNVYCSLVGHSDLKPYIYKNGAVWAPGTNGGNGGYVAMPLWLTTSDYVSIYASGNGSVSRTVTGASSFFGMKLQQRT